MAKIRPFRGILYNPEKISDIASVVTEPYDVISPAQQSVYYKTHLYNIIRLILGKRNSKDTGRNNHHTRAKKYLTDWLKQDILCRDKNHSNISIFWRNVIYTHIPYINIPFSCHLKACNHS